MPNTRLGERWRGLTVFVAACAIAVLFAFSAGEQAGAATFDYSAVSDVCDQAGLSINVVVGDVVNLHDTQTTCTTGDVTPWADLWDFAFVPDGPDWIFQVTIDEPGSATVFFSGNPMTINASATVPGAPTGVSAVGGDGQATISFSPPASDGGAAITSYTVTASPGGATGTGASSPITVTGLTNGTSYTFTVTATNSAGEGPASAASNAVTPATVPGAPTGVSAVGGNTQATVSFSAPASDGGAAITSYTATASPGGATGTGANSPITVTGLANGTSYTFTVTATNSVGEGPASATSNATTPYTSPGAPGIGTAAAGNGQATVSFTSPADDGGNAVTSYAVTASPGGAFATGANSPLTVTGLTNGQSYTFTVTATNNAGAGPASAASNAVTPMAGTHVILTVDPPSSVYSSPPRLVANVSGDGAPTGTVQFFRGAEAIATVALDEHGVAEFESDLLDAGNYTFTASYSGSASHTPATSDGVTHTVSRASTTIEVEVAASQVYLGENSELIARLLAPPDSTGTLVFRANDTVLGVVSLEDGKRSLSIDWLSLGVLAITVEYSGDANVEGSVSTPVELIVYDHAQFVPTAVPTSTPPAGTPAVPPPTADVEPPTTAPVAVLSEPAPAGTSVIAVSGLDDLKVGDTIRLDPGMPNEEDRTVVALNPLTLDRPLELDHASGGTVLRITSGLPQDPPAGATPFSTPLPPSAGTGVQAGGTNGVSVAWLLPLILAIAVAASGLWSAATRLRR